MESKNLVIVESPAKAKTIEKYLGKGYVVMSSVGHIRDLAISGPGGLGVDVENEFEPKYSVIRGKKKVINELKKEAKDCDMVYIATDPDREGEAISWHIKDSLELDEEKYYRVVFNEITKNAVVKAFDHPRKIDMDLVKSQESRRILDRIIGFKLSGLLQNKIKSKSAGRVQSVALKLIVEREKEIAAFNPEEYWTIETLLEKDNHEFSAKFVGKGEKEQPLNNEAEVKVVLDELSDNYEVSKVNKTFRNRNPKAPFITSTLQQTAVNRMNFNAKKTMRIAQQLYEGIALPDGPMGLITYMRTDSTRLSPDFISSAKEFIKSNYGKDYVGAGVKTNNKQKKVQDAHEAIRPTNVDYTPESLKKYLDADQLKLYTLIWSRAVSSQMAPAKTHQTTILYDNSGYTFKTTGTKLVFDGYLKVFDDSESKDEQTLPSINEQEVYISDKITEKQHFTSPPARYTEARLIKEMEQLGIGRPSTYAAIIDTLKIRNYVEMDKKRFIPTEQGVLTTEKLNEYFNSVINVSYTANMEGKLDKISEGELVWHQELSEFYNEFIPLLDKAYDGMEKIAPKEAGFDCPKCGSPMVVRKGRYGEFTSCSNYPECKHIHKEQQDEPEKTGETCPECGEGEILIRTAKKGRNAGNKFYACNRFPKCKYTKKIDTPS